MFFIKMNGIFLPLIVTVLSMGTIPAMAQKPLPKPPDTSKKNADTTKKAALNPLAALNALAAIKPYKEIVPATARTGNSFFKVHLVKDRYLLEIPDSLLGRDVLSVIRIEKGANGLFIPLVNIGYSGDELGRAVIRFDKIPGDKLALRSIKFDQITSDTTGNGLSRALANNNEQLIEAVFPVKAINKEGASTVIDITDFLNAKTMTSAFTRMSPFGDRLLGVSMPDRSYIKNVMAFPNNIEITMVKTIVYGTGTYTLDINSSLIILPKVPMQARLKDPRIGFLSNDFSDMDKDPHAITGTRYIQRWRMEPKAEDREKYLRGELVEPKKPIIIYIDPATPQKWVPYLMAGVNDWQAAFEKAGFKNAIFAMEAPKNDTTWSIYDARHSVIVYKPSNVPNAMGPNVNDPRSGEILETHINWYHQVMMKLQDWYTVQAGAVDPRGLRPELDDKLMGQLIRFVSSHEVGHTLGLEHNFGASSTVPVAKLRDKAWVEAHGHTPSIMDYARFNYVAQPEDQISEKGIFPRIGDYDKWAIEWGYRWLPQFRSAEQERPFLSKWIIDKLASGKQYFYGSQINPITDALTEMNSDPRSQSEDLGDDAMLASTYGIKNFKRMVPHLTEWFRNPNEPYNRATEIYGEIITTYGRFMRHVMVNIGGLQVTPRTIEQNLPVYEITPKTKQQRAMVFLQKELFATPYWLMNNKLYKASSADFVAVLNTQSQVLQGLLNTNMINKLLTQEQNFPGKAYTAMGMLNDLKRGIFSELTTHQKISIYRRGLQNQYVTILAGFLKQGGVGEIQTLLKAHTKSLIVQLKGTSGYGDAVTRLHLQSLADQLVLVLNEKNIINIQTPAAPALPALPRVLGAF